MYCRLISRRSGSDWYKGTANAIYQNISFIERYDPQYVIILSGDQICKQDYSDFLRFHKEKECRIQCGCYGSTVGRCFPLWPDGS